MKPNAEELLHILAASSLDASAGANQPDVDEFGQPPTVDDLYRTVKRQHPMLFRHTASYTPGVLQQAGVVRGVIVGHEVVGLDRNMTVRHHLIGVGFWTDRRCNG